MIIAIRFIKIINCDCLKLFIKLILFQEYIIIKFNKLIEKKIKIEIKINNSNR